MFEITGADIASLSDGDLRTLIARLALSELRAQGCALSSVTAGGNQDAADGGLDVRVECPSAIPKPDFVPRPLTGFQVKRPDMPASAIRDEMLPDGQLRPVISELAAASGAYIIVSSHGSVADKPLADRRTAMRDQLRDLDDADKLHTDFYDRDRLATWANEYPGIAAWVRNRIGLGLAGWSSIGDWTGTKVSEPGIYLFNDKACLTDERSREREQLTIGEGIARLRAALRTPKQCVRLIGLSGLGKTRLVQALFESDVGEESLEPSIAIYTDYSVETDPTARDMARQLVMSGHRAILVVDNCNPATHSELARICSEGASNVSLLTVEYDVRDDEPERTEVFRLQSTSPELVSQWLEQWFPDVSQIDRRTIADFSDGNFRVARALAETLDNGESLGKLKSRDLFERIFQQRNEPDQSLLLAAEDLSLLYSVDGEDTTDGSELQRLGSIRGIGPNVFYAALATLRRRGVVQTRGRWRAILPHAIANPLATFALERIPPADFDHLCASLTPRMKKSLSRRLGYLHDSIEAQGAVARWLRDDGPLGNLISLGEDGLQIMANIAPVAPGAVLAKIAQELDGPDGQLILAPNNAARWRWVRLIKALAYDPQFFERATMLLARFVAAEPEDQKSNSAIELFAELFHLYLSGTQAPPIQRHDIVRHLAKSGDQALRRCASIALRALLAHHFSSSSDFDFGARSRDWGWRPKFNRDVWAWYDDAINLTVELAPAQEDARHILASNVRSLWNLGACRGALERAATTFVAETPWIEGWIGFRAAHRLEGKEMPDDVRTKLEAIIDRLKPSDLLNQARAMVLNRTSGGLDIADGEPDDGDLMRPWEKASEMAQEIGRSLARDPATRKEFLAELLLDPHAPRAFECGRGLAEGADDLSTMWRELGAQFASTEQTKRNATVLGGFIFQAHQRDTSLAMATLEAAIEDRELGPTLPYLQARVGIDKDGIARLQRAIARGLLQASDFYSIANGVVTNSPPEDLSALLLDIAGLPDGVAIALDILHMHFHRDRADSRPRNRQLIATGRELLRRLDFSKGIAFRDFGVNEVIRICSSGSEGEATAREVCIHLRAAFESIYFSAHDANYVLKALFETQPFAALDIFVLGGTARRGTCLFDIDFGFGTPVEDIDSAILRQWADIDAATRYPLLGQAIPMFGRKHGDESNVVAAVFLELLEYAPDKRAFLGGYWERLQPHGWSGSLADILIRRRAQVLKFRESPHAEVRQWVDDNLPLLDHWIENEQKRDRGREESFE